MITFALGLFLLTFLSRIDGSHQACDANEFTCNDGSCVDDFLVCDGPKHCSDGSDETSAVCSKANIKCPAFRCAYGACIDENLKCDGTPDCADGSDEAPNVCSTNNTSQSNSSRICPLGNFACDSKQCISEFLLCDGEVNCRDGSDETQAKCINFPCPPIVGFQCAYGGCIDKDRKCDNNKDCKDGSDEDPVVCGSPSLVPNKTDFSGPGGCTLPPEQMGGYYNVITGCEGPNARINKCRGVAGTPVDKFTVIVFACYNGYKLETNQTELKAVCVDGEWNPTVPKCLKLCHPLRSNTLTISCNYKDTAVDCGSPMFPGTKANLKCKPSYIYQGSDSNTGNPVCDEDGVWTESLFRCKPECGIPYNSKVTTLIRGGTPTSAAEFPWHTALYKFEPKINDFEVFCGGTIITPYMILSAAHCFETINEPSKIKVIIGKTNRSYLIHDPEEQRMDVAEIYRHSDYTGVKGWYAFDLAILELTKNIVVGSTAMPVCIENIPPWTILETGTSGIAVGFGRNEVNHLTDQLMVVKMPYLDQPSCWRTNVAFRSYITHDKFCATFINEAGVQQGDSGGGIVFQKSQDSLFYIRGIVSTKPQDLNKYATFTNISEKTHVNFIKEIRTKLALIHG